MIKSLICTVFVVLVLVACCIGYVFKKANDSKTYCLELIKARTYYAKELLRRQLFSALREVGGDTAKCMLPHKHKISHITFDCLSWYNNSFVSLVDVSPYTFLSGMARYFPIFKVTLPKEYIFSDNLEAFCTALNRIFTYNYESAISSISEIEQFYMFLLQEACGFPIDLDKFVEFCQLRNFPILVTDYFENELLNVFDIRETENGYYELYITFDNYIKEEDKAFFDAWQKENDSWKGILNDEF